ncbi:MAG: hypothetical protein PHN61_12110 [Methanothrix sp.]|nr:hypothetical protein [Methanothrix sp.]
MSNAVPTLVFACKAGEVAFAKKINGKRKGVFIHYWLEILEHDPTVTFRDAIRQVNLAMRHEKFSQQAEVICRIDILDMPVNEVSLPDKAHVLMMNNMCRTKMENGDRMKSDIMGDYESLGILPLPTDDVAFKLLKGDFGDYPLFAFLLYSEVDEDLAEFIRLKGRWLHSLSGSDCLIGVFENPSAWGEGWKRNWQKRLGCEFNKLSAEWQNITPFDRDEAFVLADKLGVDKALLPCLVFIEDLKGNKLLNMPLVANNADFAKYFQDIFSCVHKAASAPRGSKLDELRSRYNLIWAKWILPQKTKNYMKEMKEWGTEIVELTDIAMKIIDPITPIIKRLSE